MKDLSDHTVRRLTKPNLEGCLPVWSPLGYQIRFMSECDRPNPHLYVMRPDGTRVRRLSHEPPNKSAGFGSYSPDGRHIVFASDIQEGFGADLFTMNTNGADQTPIVTDHRHLLFSDWGTNTSTTRTGGSQ